MSRPFGEKMPGTAARDRLDDVRRSLRLATRASAISCALISPAPCSGSAHVVARGKKRNAFAPRAMHVDEGRATRGSPAGRSGTSLPVDLLELLQPHHALGRDRRVRPEQVPLDVVVVKHGPSRTSSSALSYTTSYLHVRFTSAAFGRLRCWPSSSPASRGGPRPLPRVAPRPACGVARRNEQRSATVARSLAKLDNPIVASSRTRFHVGDEDSSNGGRGRLDRRGRRSRRWTRPWRWSSARARSRSSATHTSSRLETSATRP